MGGFPIVLAIGGVVVLLVAAVVGILTLGRGLTSVEPGPSAGGLAGTERLGSWRVHERTRLFAAALLGAIAAVGCVIVTAKYAWWTGLFVAGSVGAIAVLLGVLLMRPAAVDAPYPGESVADATPARGVRWGFVSAVVAAGFSALIAVGAAWVAEPTPDGRWGMPFRRVDGIQYSNDGRIHVDYMPGHLTPWFGWPDAGLLLGLTAVAIALLAITLRRLGSDVDLGGARGVHEARRFIVAAVVAGGLAAQVGLIGFIVGAQLASLTDVDTTESTVLQTLEVSLQPQATVGAFLAVLGVVALVGAVVQLVLAGMALMKLDRQHATLAAR